MAVHLSTLKRERQTAVRRMRNRVIVSRMKTLMKKANADMAAGPSEAAQASLKIAVAALDKAAGKGVVHKKKASRLISKMSRRYHQLAQPASSES